MTWPHTAVLAVLGAGGTRGTKVASVICRLVKEGGALGELEAQDTIGADGQRRAIKVPPRRWFERLGLAIERGAIERMSVENIVARILAPEGERASP